MLNIHIIFHILCLYWHINNHTFLFIFLLLLPIIDLLQQFEDYVKGIELRKRKGLLAHNLQTHYPFSLMLC
jgi:hypothetical protein